MYVTIPKLKKIFLTLTLTQYALFHTCSRFWFYNFDGSIGSAKARSSKSLTKTIQVEVSPYNENKGRESKLGAAYPINHHVERLLPCANKNLF
jgi:hypothetical protein